VDGDGESACEASGTLVAVVGDDARLLIKAVKKIWQIAVHMSMRWKLGIHLVVKERITMVRQKSEIGLETMNVTRGDIRWRYIVGSPGERQRPGPTVPLLIFLGKVNMITRFMNQNPQKDVAVVHRSSTRPVLGHNDSIGFLRCRYSLKFGVPESERERVSHEQDIGYSDFCED